MAFREAKNKIKQSDRFKWIFNGMMQKILCPPNLIHLSDFSQKISRYNTIKHQEIIHNAITQDYFNIPLKSKTDNVLMYIGVIDLNKNLIYLLTMLKMMIEKKCYYRLEVIGGFSTEKYRRIVMSYIHKNNLEEYVHFNGWVTQQEVVKIIAKADILVVCSKHESLPMVIAESMAAGKVVVASSVGGIPEMFTNHVSGFVFDLNQQQQLIHLLKKLYNNDQLCLQIGQSAKVAAAEKFKAENIAQKTILFYKKLNTQPVNS
jgi:glycosyltransferase involved in cell wall biosynthesis